MNSTLSRLSALNDLLLPLSLLFDYRAKKILACREKEALNSRGQSPLPSIRPYLPPPWEGTQVMTFLLKIRERNSLVSKISLLDSTLKSMAQATGSSVLPK